MIKKIKAKGLATNERNNNNNTLFKYSDTEYKSI